MEKDPNNKALLNEYLGGWFDEEDEIGQESFEELVNEWSIDKWPGRRNSFVRKQYSLQDAYDVAWQFAARAHAGQKLPDSDLPYLTHIGWVVGEILISLQYETISDPNLAIQCAILHDVMEDTTIGYQELSENSESIVSDGALVLSKNMALPKNERMMDSLERILCQPNEVGMVKLVDRISNLRTPPSFWDASKIAEYIEESNKIIAMLEKTSAYLSARIKIKLRQYQSDFCK